MFAGKKRGLDFKIEEGNKVIVSGNINVYERDGKYQLYADKIEKEGTGDLYKRFIELKNELEEMGMFSDEYKKEIPKYSMNVGIVTASTGAAIQDIINISKRRNPYIKLVLYPAKVQGDGAADTIVNGIRCLDSKNLDVIIVGRGGGSIEDLWAFNEEKVARAIFECNTPVISAVGHETDYTIADYVADMRAPTPSAAAELVVFEYNKLCEKISSYEENMRYRIDIKIRNYRNTVNDLLWKLNKMSPANNIQSKRQRLADLEIRLYDSINRKTSERRHQLELLTERLNGLSPLNKLSGGYAYISDDKNKPVKSIKKINADDELKIVLKDGNAKVKVIDKTVFDSEF
jgi:exodeoxyribonuclease VII, large subunit